MTVEYAEPGRSASPWNDEGSIAYIWPRAVRSWTPLEPEPFVTDVPVPTEETPCWEYPDMWFPEKVGGHARLFVKTAKIGCSYCWMLKDCREYALTHNVDGIWGGLTKAERTAMKPKKRAS